MLIGSAAMLWGYFCERRAGPAALRRPGVPALPARATSASACSTASARPRAGSSRPSRPLARGARASRTRHAMKRSQTARAARPPLRPRDHARPRWTSCLELVPWAARAPHRDHGQRLHLVHDAPRPGPARRLPRGDLIVADGMSVVWTSRLAGVPFPERVAGVDLMAPPAGRPPSEHRLRVYFLGARREVVAELARRCARDYPGLEVAGFRDGYFGPGGRGRPSSRRSGARRRTCCSSACRARSRRPGASGTAQALDVPVIMGVGGTFDVLAGLRAARPALRAVAGARVVLAAGHGAAQDVEALPAHELASTSGWPRGRSSAPAPGWRASRDEPRRTPSGLRASAPWPSSWARGPEAHQDGPGGRGPAARRRPRLPRGGHRPAPRDVPAGRRPVRLRASTPTST